jgi:putative membrane protein
MIKYNPKNWFKLIFALHKSDTMRILWKEIIYTAALSALIAFIAEEYWMENRVLKELIGVYSLVGFVISLLLVFRTNTAYDRWWEGRKKWGALVNDTRNLALKTSVMTGDKEDRDFFRRMISNFVFATKEHLRNGVDFEELKLTDEEAKLLKSKVHVPNAVSQLMFDRVRKLKQAGKISDEEFIILDKNLNALLDNLGACERIRNTPIPFSYSLFLKKFIFIYVSTLPLVFVTLFHYYSIIIVTFVFYVLVSIEVLAEEIEDPFGKDDNDLPTDELCSKIRANVDEIFES